ncbi:MAG TPA: glycoside hydrolase family 15 protein, partial [Acidimicrobiales bacterium]|nr:glycoside hydrolase family 15 protein [Acidimicrobiales bacterium]
TGTGSVRVLDSLNASSTGQLPWVELGRVVEGVDGHVTLAWEIAPGTKFGSARGWASTTDQGVPLMRIADQTLGVVATGIGEPVVERARVHGAFDTAPGSRHVLGVVATDDEPLYLPTPDRVAQRVTDTVDWWRTWADRVDYDGPWRDGVRRSALVLKLLTFSETGAILAAPTTSLPEIVGGDKNYDYRFAWVRDMAFAICAMLRLGVEEEVHASLSWLLGTVRRTAPDVHVFYTVHSQIAELEQDVAACGYKGSRPVRSGNTAEQQTQLESFGALFDPVWEYVAEGNQLDERTGSMLATCADRVCDIWTRPDAGLWELTDARHYTASKVGCWTALDRAARLAAAGQLPDRHRARWEAERGAVAAWVRSHCWSEHKRAYVFYAGSDDLDAAVLLSARIGFDRGERMRSTIDALRRELSRGALMYRYTGMVEKEGAFLACSFWLVEALALTGQAEEAASLMTELCALANDVGLFSEEMDPATGAMLGNFPQALTHLALVNAAAAVRECQVARRRGRDEP